VVLVEPQKSENIGTAARAMSNMGLGNLVLVRPRVSKPELMEAAATRLGEPVIKNLTTFEDLKSALAPYQIVVGTTARAGSSRGPFADPKTLAPELLKEKDPPRVAILFGTERMGLSTEDLRLCHKTMIIPTDSPESSSLNLAQAVLIIGYELLSAAAGTPSPALPIIPAENIDFERAMEDLKDTLIQIGFLPEKNPAHWFMNVKKIFRRSYLTRGECDLIQGICRQIRWKIENPKDDENKS
jgi:tRNA/rRNA methyltransferase